MRNIFFQILYMLLRATNKRTEIYVQLFHHLVRLDVLKASIVRLLVVVYLLCCIGKCARSYKIASLLF